MEEERPGRKPRSDKGLILVTERDLYCIAWIAEQYAVRGDQIRQLLSRFPDPKRPFKNKLMGETTVKDQISRWKRAGWIEYRRVLAGSPGWAWVTKKGLQLVDLDEIYTAREPASTRLNHLYAVAEVRLHSDEKYTWKSERRYRSEEIAKIKGKKGKTTGAIPDGIITTQKGDHIAIEAEISVKKPEEIAAKLVRLVRQSVLTGGYQHESAYSMIWFYVSSERIQRVVEAGIEVLLDEEKQRVGIVLVPTIVASKR